MGKLAGSFDFIRDCIPADHDINACPNLLTHDGSLSTSDVEVIPIQLINEAFERMLTSDVKYRFSIDMASLKSE